MKHMNKEHNTEADRQLPLVQDSRLWMSQQNLRLVFTDPDQFFQDLLMEQEEQA